MNRLVRKLRSSSLVRDARGLTTVEYVIVLAMIAVLAVGLWSKFGANISNYVKNSTKQIDQNMPKLVKTP
jgi:Flp pilus assembly pilin Flp